jgi:hypothetical protein
MAAPAIIAHSLDQALAAASAAASLGAPLVLLSAGGAAGVGWFGALGALVAERHPGLDLTLVFDCDDEAGTAMGALRRGLTHLRFTGPPEVARKLAAMGAILYQDAAPALDLHDVADPEGACRNRLSAGTLKS